MKKRFLILTCVMGLSISSLAACGSGETNSNTPSAITSEQNGKENTETVNKTDEVVGPMSVGPIEEASAYVIIGNVKVDIDATWEEFKEIMDQNGWTMAEEDYPTNGGYGGEVTIPEGKISIRFMENSDKTGFEINNIKVMNSELASSEGISICGVNPNTSVDELKEKLLILRDDDSHVAITLDKYVYLKFSKDQTAHDSHITLVRETYKFRADYPYPEDYDHRKYSWRQSTLYNDCYVEPEHYANAGRCFYNQTFEEILQMAEDPSCDFDIDEFFTHNAFKGVTIEQIQYLYDNGYDMDQVVEMAIEQGKLYVVDLDIWD